MTSTDPITLAPPPVPYRGIESFRYVDQPIFFARDEETEHLVRYVSIYRGTLFYGDSGAGKSSLINAGFIPRMIEEGFTPDRIRVQPRRDEEIIIERIVAVADGPPAYLPSSFADDGEAASRLVLSAGEFIERLRGIAAERRPLLIFDQFEEFVTLFEEAPQGEAMKEALQAQEKVLDMIIGLLRDHSLPVKCLFVFREDYLAKLAKLTSRSPGLQQQFQRITPLHVDALHEVIRGSFERFPDHFGRELSPALARDLAAAIEARSESGRLNLSEVQIACLRLWQSPDAEALFRANGVEGLLEGYLSDAIGRLPADLRDPAVALLSRLLTSGGTRNVISGGDLVTLVRSEEDIPAERLEAALRALEQETRLVRRERRHDTIFYEIVSEFLVPWIRRQKSERALRIEQRKYQEQVRVKRLKIMRWSGVAVLVILAGEGYLFSTQQGKIMEQERALEIQKTMAYRQALKDSIVSEAGRRADSVDRERRAALEQRALALRERDSAVELRGSLMKSRDSVLASWNRSLAGALGMPNGASRSHAELLAAVRTTVSELNAQKSAARENAGAAAAASRLALADLQEFIQRYQFIDAKAQRSVTSADIDRFRRDVDQFIRKKYGAPAGR